MDRYCQNCNTQNSPEAMFCRQCATPLTQGQGGQQAQFGNQQWTPTGAGGQAAQNIAPTAAGASGRAIAATVLAVCGLVLCCGPFTGIPGAILGWMEMNAIKEGRSSPKGMMMAQIGLWGGIASSVIGGVANVLVFLSMLSGGMYY